MSTSYCFFHKHSLDKANSNKGFSKANFLPYQEIPHVEQLSMVISFSFSFFQRRTKNLLKHFIRELILQKTPS